MPSGKASAKYGFQYVFGFLSHGDNDIIPGFVRNLTKVGADAWPGEPSAQTAEKAPIESLTGWVTVFPPSTLDPVADAKGRGTQFKIKKIREQASGRPGRIYVVGHGDWRAGSINGYSPADIAGVIKACFKREEISVICVVSCQLGMYKDPGEYSNTSCGSFCAKLHHSFGAGGPNVHGYTEYVAVQNAVPATGIKSGQKGTRLMEDTGPLAHHAEHGKQVFFWNGDSQECRYAYRQPAPVAAIDPRIEFILDDSFGL
jgi:hypothetical protein